MIVTWGDRDFGAAALVGEWPRLSRRHDTNTCQSVRVLD
jgi:hypothetical protein